MPGATYDFYWDMLETHRENGYLLALVGVLIFYILGVVVCLMSIPPEDIYLVPGVDRYGVAEVTWGVVPGAAVRAGALDELASARVDREPFIPAFVPPELSIERVDDKDRK